MVLFYVAGKVVGDLAQTPEVFSRLVEAGATVEFKTDAGKELGVFTPKTIPKIPWDLRTAPLVPWDPTLTEADLAQRESEGGMSLADFWVRMRV